MTTGASPAGRPPLWRPACSVRLHPSMTSEPSESGGRLRSCWRRAPPCVAVARAAATGARPAVFTVDAKQNALKRVRQSEKTRVHNKGKKSEISTRIKRVSAFQKHSAALFLPLRKYGRVAASVVPNHSAPPAPTRFAPATQFTVAAKNATCVPVAGEKRDINCAPSPEDKERVAALLAAAFRVIDKAVRAVTRPGLCGLLLLIKLFVDLSLLQAGKGILKQNTANRRKAAVSRLYGVVQAYGVEAAT